MANTLPIRRTLHRCPDTCETCRFWQPDEDFDDNVLGECRLRSPRFNSLAAESGRADDPAGFGRGRWPLTESRDWCAEWSRGAEWTRGAA